MGDHGDRLPERNPANNRVVYNDTSGCDCDKVPIAAGETPPGILLTHGGMLLQQLRERTNRNGMIVRSSASLVELTGVPTSPSPSSQYTPSPLSTPQLSLSSRLSPTSRSTPSPASSYCGMYERALDETLDRVSDGRPVSPDPTVLETCTVHPAYHRVAARPHRNGSPCYPKDKPVNVATVNGARLRGKKTRPSSGGADYFWRSVIEP
ncbi:hypothetical protein LSAT2_025963 [Lamellibrachia satsuma]|nr:hypothetical protein LSAT2_025963 [Lamellibrachia satsuma]